MDQNVLQPLSESPWTGRFQEWNHSILEYQMTRSMSKVGCPTTVKGPSTGYPTTNWTSLAVSVHGWWLVILSSPGWRWIFLRLLHVLHWFSWAQRMTRASTPSFLGSCPFMSVVPTTAAAAILLAHVLQGWSSTGSTFDRNHCNINQLLTTDLKFTWIIPCLAGCCFLAGYSLFSMTTRLSYPVKITFTQRIMWYPVEIAIYCHAAYMSMI